MTDPEQIKQFLFAGNARITLKSLKSGDHFTYRVKAAKNKSYWIANGPASHFVSVLTGPDNETSFSYLGYYKNSGWPLRRTAKSLDRDAPSARAWEWFERKLFQGVIPENLEMWHEGRCGMCGRTLTVPESIARGIGPECAERLGA